MIQNYDKILLYLNMIRKCNMEYDSTDSHIFFPRLITEFNVCMTLWNKEKNHRKRNRCPPHRPTLNLRNYALVKYIKDWIIKQMTASNQHLKGR